MTGEPSVTGGTPVTGEHASDGEHARLRVKGAMTGELTGLRVKPAMTGYQARNHGGTRNDGGANQMTGLETG